MEYLEWVANAFFVVSVMLAARNNVNTWWVGIVGCILFSVLFYKVQLYADVTLMIFFMMTSIYGWAYWGKNQGKSHPIQRTNPIRLGLFSIAALLATFGYGGLLLNTTDAYAPFVDSFVLMFSVLGQFLLMNRRIETWVCWLIVDTVAVPLYASRELYLTSIVYAIFWCNAWYGFYIWLKIYKKEQAGEKAWETRLTAED